MSRKETDESPQGLELNPKPKVLGMSRTPMIIVGVMLGVILLVYVAVMANKNSQDQQARAIAPILVDRDVPSRGIVSGTGESGIIQAGMQPDEDSKTFEHGNVKIERPDVREEEEHPKIVTVYVPKETPASRYDEQYAQEQDDIRRMHMDNMRSAIRAPMNTGIKVNVASSTGSSGQGGAYGYSAPQSSGDIDVDKMTAHLRGEYTPEVRARLEAAGAGSGGIGGGVDFFGGGSTASTGSATDRDWQLGFQRKAGRTYELKTGTVIPGVLITGINSDLAGAVTAQVSQPVFDSTTGDHLLIPQGSKLYGDYASSVAFGQNRLFVAWKRIIFPDGSSMTIGDMRGSDQAGYSGFHDKVNNHYLRMFGATLFMSAISAGTTYAVDHLNDNNNGGDSDSPMRDEMAMALAQQMGQLSMNLLQKHLNVSPTIEIRPGYKFSIVVTKDVVFDAAYEPMATVR